MTTTDLSRGVLRCGGWLTAAATAGGWWIAGWDVATGVLGGSLVALLNFRWLCRDVSRATALAAGGGAGPRRIAGLGVRQMASFAALALLVTTGWAHPVGLAAGLALLPPVLFAEGIRAARGSD